MWLGPSFEGSDDLMGFIAHFRVVTGTGPYTLPEIVDRYIKTCDLHDERNVSDMMQNIDNNGLVGGSQPQYDDCARSDGGRKLASSNFPP